MRSKIFSTTIQKPTSAEIVSAARNASVSELSQVPPAALSSLETAAGFGISNDAELNNARTQVQSGIKEDLFKGSARIKTTGIVSEIAPSEITLPPVSVPNLNIEDSELIGGVNGFLDTATDTVQDQIDVMSEKVSWAEEAVKLCPGGSIDLTAITDQLDNLLRISGLYDVIEGFLNLGDSDLFNMLVHCAGMYKDLGNIKISSLTGRLAEQGKIESFRLIVGEVGKENVPGLDEKIKILHENVEQDPENPYQDLDDFLTETGTTRLDIVGVKTHLLGGDDTILDANTTRKVIKNGTTLVGSDTPADENSFAKLEMAAVVSKMVEDKSSNVNTRPFGSSLPPQSIKSYSAFA